MAYDKTRNRYRAASALCPECFEMNLNIDDFAVNQGRGGETAMQWMCTYCKKEMEVYMETESLGRAKRKIVGLE